MAHDLYHSPALDTENFVLILRADGDAQVQNLLTGYRTPPYSVSKAKRILRAARRGLTTRGLPYSG